MAKKKQDEPYAVVDQGDRFEIAAADGRVLATWRVHDDQPREKAAANAAEQCAGLNARAARNAA